MEPAVRAVRLPSGPPSTRFSSFHLHARAPRRATRHLPTATALWPVRVWLGLTDHRPLTDGSSTPVPPALFHETACTFRNVRCTQHEHGACKIYHEDAIKEPRSTHFTLLPPRKPNHTATRKKERSQHSNRAAHAQLLHILIQTHFHSVVATKRGWTIKVFIQRA